MNFIDEISIKTSFCEKYAQDYIRYVVRLLEGLDLQVLTRIAHVMAKARDDKRMIFLLGNGGSAATASHFAQDLALGARAKGKPIFKTISLADNVSSITALGNDRGYEEVFSGQMEGVFEPSDILIAFSASGNSENVLKAVRYAGQAFNS